MRENDTGGKFSELAPDTGSTATTYTDDSVAANTTYTHRIKAINEHGVSERSRWFHIDIPAAPERPDKPTGLSATASHDSVPLNWDDPGDDTITGYVILRRNRQTTVSGQFSELVADTGSAATTYTDDTVAAETNYTYRIKAINEHGVSERSRWFHIDIPAAPEAVEGDDQDEQGGEDDGDGTPGHATPPGPGRRANVSEPDGEDLPDDTTTSGRVEVGGSVTGNIFPSSDEDMFAVELESGTRYQIDLEGEPTARGTQSDPLLQIRNADGTVLASDDDGGVGVNARVIFTPTGDATYYLYVDTPDGSPGTYTLSVILLGANGASEADTDFPTTTTTGEVDVGGSVTGNIASSTDLDWFAVVLEAGKTYQIDLKGENGGGGTLEDSLLGNIRDSSGTEIDGTENDDVDYDNDIYDSQITFTPTAAGTYYLVASRAGSSTGTYTLSVREIACTLNTGDIWCGVVTVGEIKSNADVLVGHGFADRAGLSADSLAGYPDDTMFSVGDNDYTISAAYIQVPTADHLTGTLFVLLSSDLTDDDKAGLVLTDDDTTITFEFSDATTGNTGLYSWGLSGLTWSSTTTVTVRLQGPTTSDDPPDDSADPPEGGFREGDTDLPADTSTGGVVEVGGFGARGAIHEPIGTSIDIGTPNVPEISTTYVFDTDWFAVELEAGRTYRIDMKGQILSSPGLDIPGVPVDPELTLSLPQINAIYDADGDYLLNTWGADESSAHHLFRVTFHAHAGGTYYIAASGESFEWGGYELTVIDITEDTD